jgi:hypothetical protein
VKKRDRKELGRYVRWCADEMGLRDWTIEMLHGEPSTDIAAYDAEVIDAAVECVFGQKLAVVTVPDRIRDQTREEVRHTIAHELTHCHLADLAEQGQHFLRQLSPAAQDAAGRAYVLALEHAVDGIAKEWARHLPLIDWPS